jgi:hypothetical protein
MNTEAKRKSGGMVFLIGASIAEATKSPFVGSWAALGRPLALRTGLSTGVPFREWARD